MLNRTQRSKKVYPWWNSTGKLATMDGEKTEVLNNFLASVFLASVWPTFLPKLSSGWRLKEQRASLVNEDQVHHHLKSLNVHNSMGPDETHPRVLRELVDAVAKPHFRTFEKLGQPGEDTVTAKRETLYPSLKIVERKTLGAPPHVRPCMERSWNWSCWNLLRHMEKRGEIQDNCHNLTKAKSLFLNWRDGFNGWSITWTRKWLNGHIQRVMVNSSEPPQSDKWFPSGVCIGTSVI